MKTSHLSAALLLGASLLLAGCGDEDPESGAEPTATSSPTETQSPAPTGTTETPTEPAEPTGPACAATWVAGEKLAADYTGCLDEDRQKWVEADAYTCSSGQRIVTYKRNFYVIGRKPIIESAVPLARDEAFKKVMATCGA